MAAPRKENGIPLGGFCDCGVYGLGPVRDLDDGGVEAARSLDDGRSDDGGVLVVGGWGA